jgi:hypothetical protein
MPSITSWLRLEPRSREDDINVGLQARIHDPLWLVARQWQLNEFKGEDSGSPVSARLEGDAFQLTRFLPGALPPTGAAAGQPFDPAAAPLETVVVRELYGRATTVDLRFAADAGRYFARLLEAQGVGRYAAAYRNSYAVLPLGDAELADLNEDGARFATAMVGRVIDGVRLYRALAPALRPATGTAALPAVPPVAAADQAQVLAAAQDWLSWYETVVSEPGAGASAWLPSNMEYQFAVSAATPQGEVVLEAPDFREGDLDWFAFQLRRSASLGAATGEARAESLARTVIPAPVKYPGMPAERWWQFEDSQVDFGAVNTLPGDVGALVLLQFVVTYGNDWFVIPIPVTVGSLCRIRALTVTDSFGTTTPIPSFSQTSGVADSWRLFALSSDQPAADGQPDPLFVPPTIGARIAPRTLETVMLVRDEMANMAWAIEKKVLDRTGAVVDRTQAAQDLSLRLPPPDQRVTYELATLVPENWIPLVPVAQGTDGRIVLRRGVLALAGAASAPHAKGRILAPEAPLVLNDEEVPRSGARVDRAVQYTRWTDGSTHLWIGRKREPGRGEASSGLRFDVVRAPGTP